MSNTELNPCPFCGGKATLTKKNRIIVAGKTERECHVHCTVCNARSERVLYKDYPTTELAHGKAKELWNTRKPMDNIVAELEIAKEKVAKEDYCRTKHYIENDCEHKDCFECCSQYLIDIVKRGGVE